MGTNNEELEKTHRFEYGSCLTKVSGFSELVPWLPFHWNKSMSKKMLANESWSSSQPRWLDSAKLITFVFILLYLALECGSFFYRRDISLPLFLDTSLYFNHGHRKFAKKKKTLQRFVFHFLCRPTPTSRLTSQRRAQAHFEDPLRGSCTSHHDMEPHR